MHSEHGGVSCSLVGTSDAARLLLAMVSPPELIRQSHHDSDHRTAARASAGNATDDEVAWS